MIDLPIPVESVEEFEMIVRRGYDPLQDWKKFRLNISLRIQIQRELFGKSFISKGDVVAANDRFYHWCWENNKQRCEECAAPLQEYSSKFISHIISRGARPEMAHDPRNKNILCFNHHQQWEETDKKKKRNRYQMNIYRTNLRIIQLLKTEYQCI